MLPPTLICHMLQCHHKNLKSFTGETYYIIYGFRRCSLRPNRESICEAAVTRRSGVESMERIRRFGHSASDQLPSTCTVTGTEGRQTNCYLVV